MIAFEVTIRPIAGAGRRWPRKWGTGSARNRAARTIWRICSADLAGFGGPAGRPRACASGALVARIGRLAAAFWPILLNPGHAAVAQW